MAASGFDDRNGYSRRDLLTATSAPIDDWNKDARGGRPALSVDGSRILVAKPAKDATSNPGFYLRDFSGGTFAPIQPEPASPAIQGAAMSLSADGRLAVFDSDSTLAGDTPGVTDVFVRNVATGDITLVSRGSAGPGDGRYVSFASRSIRLVAGPPNGAVHLYVRDTRTGTTTLVDRVPGGGALGSGDAAFSALSADGRYVAFESSATNLVAGAFPGSVYRADLGAPTPVPGGAAAPGVTGAGGQGAASFRCAGLAATRVGTPGRDLIRGTSKRDVIVALAGADRVIGAGGDDVICLGAGDDTADGGPGKDRVLGGAGKDALKGGAGPDLLVGAAGADALSGGAGRDILRGGGGRNALTQ